MLLKMLVSLTAPAPGPMKASVYLSPSAGKVPRGAPGYHSSEVAFESISWQSGATTAEIGTLGIKTSWYLVITRTIPATMPATRRTPTPTHTPTMTHLVVSLGGAAGKQPLSQSPGRRTLADDRTVDGVVARIAGDSRQDDRHFGVGGSRRDRSNDAVGSNLQMLSPVPTMRSPAHLEAVGRKIR